MSTSRSAATHSVFLDRLWIWGVVAFYGLLALGQLERVELPGLPAFYLHDGVLALYVNAHVAEKSWRQLVKRAVQQFPTLGWVSLGWVGAGLLAAAATHHSITYSLLVLSRFGLYLLAGSCLHLDLYHHKVTPRLLRSGLTFFFAALALFGFLQYLFLPDVRFLYYLGWDDHYYRLISTIFDPGFTGLLFTLGYLFLQQATPQVRKPLRRYLQLLSLLMVLAVLLTYSRASYIALGVSLALLAWRSWSSLQKKAALTQVVIACGFIFAMFWLPRPGGEGVRLERTSTIVARLDTAQAALQTVDSPIALILGNGLFVFSSSDPETQVVSPYTGRPSHAQIPDNWVLTLLSGTGLVGTVLGCALLVMLLRGLFHQSGSLLGVAILAVLSHGLFNASLTYPFVWLVLISWGALTLESSRG